MKIENVLSLFDGMSCGQIALNKLGIKYDNYYASEIDEPAISVTQHNYPNTIVNAWSAVAQPTDWTPAQASKLQTIIDGYTNE